MKLNFKNQISNFFFYLTAIIGFFFSVIHSVSIHKTGYRSPLMPSQFGNFIMSCHTISDLTFEIFHFSVTSCWVNIGLIQNVISFPLLGNSH